MICRKWLIKGHLNQPIFTCTGNNNSHFLVCARGGKVATSYITITKIISDCTRNNSGGLYYLRTISKCLYKITISAVYTDQPLKRNHNFCLKISTFFTENILDNLHLGKLYWNFKFKMHTPLSLLDINKTISARLKYLSLGFDAEEFY